MGTFEVALSFTYWKKELTFDFEFFFCFIIFPFLIPLEAREMRIELSGVMTDVVMSVVIVDPPGWGQLIVLTKASLRFEKTRENIDSFRGFIDKFGLLSTRSEALVLTGFFLKGGLIVLASLQQSHEANNRNVAFDPLSVDTFRRGDRNDRLDERVSGLAGLVGALIESILLFFWTSKAPAFASVSFLPSFFIIIIAIAILCFT